MSTSIADLHAAVAELDGILVVVPGEGSGLPELAWGDSFLYYAPDGVMPTTVQPFATIVTKDYPDDTASRLGEGRFRLNVNVSRERFVALTGEEPRALERPREQDLDDTVHPHPVYGAMGWIAIVNPGASTTALAVELLREAHAAAKARAERRDGV